MILMDIADTEIGKDIMAVINPLTIAICVGVAYKIVQVLYALACESITIDKAKNKVRLLFKVIIITVSLSELSGTIVNGYLLSRVDQSQGSTALVIIFRCTVILFRDLIGAASVISGALSMVLLILKLIQIQKAPDSDDIAELKKQAVRIVKIGVLITMTLSLVTMFCDYLGVRLG